LGEKREVLARGRIAIVGNISIYTGILLRTVSRNIKITKILFKTSSNIYKFC